MTLPTSRNVTASPGSPVYSSLLNALQDMFPNGGKRSSSWRWVAPTVPLVQPTGTNTLTEDTFTFGSSGSFAGMSCGPYQEGDRITAFAVRHFGNATAGSPQYLLKLNQGNGTLVTLGTLTLVNPPASWATYSFTLVTPVVLAAGQSLILKGVGNASAGGDKLGNIGIQSDRL